MEVDLSGDGGVTKHTVTEGTGPFPSPGDRIEAHYVGTLQSTGAEFDSSRKRAGAFTFTLGENGVIKGWEIGFAQMRKGEKAVLTIRGDYGYGDRGSPPTIPGKATLVFEVELLKFGPKPKEKWEMSPEELLVEAKKLKELGNEGFKKGDMGAACEAFEEALTYTKEMSSTTEDGVAKECKELENLLRTNAAQAYINAKDFPKAISMASAVLKEDPTYLKALLRRATAYSAYGMTGEASADLKKCQELAIDNVSKEAVRKQVRLLHERAEVAKQNEKKQYAGMFNSSKVSLYDDKPMNVSIAHDRHKNAKRVFMDVKIGEEPAERVEFELWFDTTPKTAQNFLELCRGTTKNLTYKGSKFHRIIKGFMCQGGDFTAGDGTGGMSIYGERFDDENFSSKHTEPFLLSMANAGPNTNGSQFFITTEKTPHLDNKHVVFGCVVKGQDVVTKMENVPVQQGDKPSVAVVIENCGQVEEDVYVAEGEETKN